MNYQSTRGFEEKQTASEAILRGLAPDGGLYVPEEIPSYNITDKSFLTKSYQELAYEIMQPLLSDFTEVELKECIQQAYDDKFDDSLIAPLKKVASDYYLELFHGPTLAFKDMALSILPYLMTTALKKQGVKNEIVILTATSGDTGKAAMEGFSDVPGTKIIVFYPKNGVSAIQERQMLTQKGDNTYVVGIHGNFDDAQTKVKEMFESPSLSEELAARQLQFSSANSINIGRLIPQIVYYFYAYQQLVNQKQLNLGDTFNVSVPTGNFGNILAAYYAKQMGLPIDKLICASNQNNVLTDFFDTGVYDRNREFYVTNSPSMDILVSSNLERLLYYIAGKDSQRLMTWMSELKTTGKYRLTPAEKENLSEFYAGFATEAEIEEVVRTVFETSEYVVDPHTAVAKKVADDYRENTADQRPQVIVSTASPYKFPQVFLGGETDSVDVSRLAELTGLEVPKPIVAMSNLKNRDEIVVQIDEMEETVLSLLN